MLDVGANIGFVDVVLGKQVSVASRPLLRAKPRRRCHAAS